MYLWCDVFFIINRFVDQNMYISGVRSIDPVDVAHPLNFISRMFYYNFISLWWIFNYVIVIYRKKIELFSLYLCTRVEDSDSESASIANGHCDAGFSHVLALTFHVLWMLDNLHGSCNYISHTTSLIYDKNYEKFYDVVIVGISYASPESSSSWLLS